MQRVQPSYKGESWELLQKRPVISVSLVFKIFYKFLDVTPRARPKIDRAPTPIGGKGYVLPGRPATTPQKPVQTLRKPTQPVGSRVHPAVNFSSFCFAFFYPNEHFIQTHLQVTSLPSAVTYQRPTTSPAYVLPNYAVPLDLNHQTLGQRQLIRAPGGSQFLVGGQETILSQNPHTLISTGLHRVSVSRKTVSDLFRRRYSFNPIFRLVR